MRITGRVKWFRPHLGYGYIVRDDGQGDVYLHFSEIRNRGNLSFPAGEHVEFETETTNRGIRALEARKIP